MLFQAITMILLDSLKVNNKFFNSENVKDSVESYQPICNFGDIKCPNCHSSALIRWGTYDRNVYYINNHSIKHIILTVQRFRCNDCGKTHGILPVGLIPYKQYATDIIVLSLLDPDSPIIQYISLDTIHSWYKQFKYFYSYLSIMFNIRDKLTILFNISKKILSFYKNYFHKFHICFMQIKFLHLNLCTL